MIDDRILTGYVDRREFSPSVDQSDAPCRDIHVCEPPSIINEDQRPPPSDGPTPGSDTRAELRSRFEDGLEAYADAKLKPHPEKEFREQLRFRMLGADVDGLRGTVGTRIDVKVIAAWLGRSP